MTILRHVEVDLVKLAKEIYTQAAGKSIAQGIPEYARCTGQLDPCNTYAAEAWHAARKWWEFENKLRNDDEFLKSVTRPI